MPHTSPTRRGFTLVELLAVVAIVGLLIAVLLPAVQSARESARRTQCGNNLRQLGLACQAFHESQGHFPGADARGASPHLFNDWGVKILPWLEMTPLFDRIDRTLEFNWPNPPPLGLPPNPNYTTNNALMKQHLPSFSCPSGHLPKLAMCCSLLPVEAASAVSYAAVNDHRDVASVADTARSGVIFHLSRISHAHIRDGSSNTLLLGETYRDYDIDLKQWYATNAPVYCPGARCYISNTWASGNAATTRWGINQRLPTRTAWAPVNSWHVGGGYFAMADGASRFIADSIANEVLWSLTTRRPGFYAGEVPVGDF